MSRNCKINSFVVLENRMKRFTQCFRGNYSLSESELLLLMVLSLFCNLINGPGDVLASYKYRFSCQTVLALKQRTDFSPLPKMMTKTQP